MPEENENELIAVEIKPKATAMDNILRAGQAWMNFPEAGDLIEGRVIKKDSKSLYLDLGIWGIGIVYGREFAETRDLVKKLHAGDQVFAKIVELENEDGLRELSLKEAGKEQTWQILKRKMEAGEVITAKITQANRGGLIAAIDGVEGFLPV
ncbi:MAG: S1 RNA-binding domain-containing protein, partial [bacterium]|nr:S1 RNA-binding domain-containing protein [bacterium]